MCNVCLHGGSGQSEYSIAIALDLHKCEVVGTVNDLCLLNFAVAELLVSATYLAEQKGRELNCCQGPRAATEHHALG